MWWQVLRLALLLSLQRKSCASSLFPGDPPPRPPIPPPRPPHPVRYFDHPLIYPSRTLHPYPAGGSASLDFYDGLEDAGETWEEDESWWDGVEEVILTNSFSDGFSYDDLFYDDLYDINYTCTDSMECEEFASLPPPPDFILTLPPPPVPPFLQGAIGRLQEEGRKRKKLEPQEEDLKEEELEWDFDQCSLCDWATGGNNTLSLLPPAPESGVGGGMIGILVGVALISAVVGAVVMVILLRCRKFKILPSGRDACPMLLRGTWTKGSATSATAGAPAGMTTRVGAGSVKTTGEEAPAATAGGGTTHTGWSMKLWRRGSSQERPLRPASSQGSENSYTEEPYVNADAQSAVYAELNSTTASTPGSASGGVSYRPYSLNTYSEIPDPLRPLSLAGGLRAYINDSTYENAGYVLSEAGLEQPESSVGSTSTPSSAYYSDVSSSDNHNNKKKKKKKKNEERNNLNLQRSLMPSNISSSVAMMNHHNLLAGPDRHNIPAPREPPPAHALGQALHPPLHNHELFPLALELLPQHLALDNRGVEAVLPPLQPNMNVIHTANQVQTLPNVKNVNESRAAVNASQTLGGTVSSTSSSGGVPSSGVTAGVTSGAPGVTAGVASGAPGVTSGAPGVTAGVTDAVQGEALNNNPEDEDEESLHRPLPPLPSRQQQGPQRRGVYVGQSKQDQPLPPVPSEYV
ncbi:uncharacterized protein [Panulirus ornatus]|uniref:uncharacterized protein n=1 Tax=Panulirus ornatus TaxID=150431 RepID=UPI003A83D50D